MKNLLVLLMLILIAPTLTSCGNSKPSETPQDKDGGNTDGGTDGKDKPEIVIDPPAPKTPEEIQIENKVEKLEEIIAILERSGGSTSALLSEDVQSRIDYIKSKTFYPTAGTAVKFVKLITEATSGSWVVVSVNDEDGDLWYLAGDLDTISSSDFAKTLLGQSEPPAGFNIFDVAKSGNNYVGEGMTFSEDADSSKDLEVMGAKVEAMEVAAMEESLINYGLSTERAQTLGKLMNSYSKIKTKRALTSREKDVFTKELTGLSFDKASSVLVDEGYDALVEKASEVNGADPEAIKALLNEVM